MIYALTTTIAHSNIIAIVPIAQNFLEKKRAKNE